MWQNWTNLTLGVWLLTAAFIPAVTSSRPANMWNNSLVGGIALLVGICAAAKNNQKMCWANAVIGMWLLASAFISVIAAVEQASFWNDLIGGILIILISAWAIVQSGISSQS